jgi:hypothetical protein
MAISQIAELFEASRLQLKKEHELKVAQIKEDIASIKKKALSKTL